MFSDLLRLGDDTGTAAFVLAGELGEYMRRLPGLTIYSGK